MSTETTMWQRILNFLERTSFPVEPQDAQVMAEASAFAATRYEFILPELMAVEAERSQYRRAKRTASAG